MKGLVGAAVLCVAAFAVQPMAGAGARVWQRQRDCLRFGSRLPASAGRHEPLAKCLASPSIRGIIYVFSRSRRHGGPAFADGRAAPRVFA